MYKETWYMNKILLSMSKEKNQLIKNTNLDESQKQDAKLNKPDTKTVYLHEILVKSRWW